MQISGEWLLWDDDVHRPGDVETLLGQRHRYRIEQI